MLEVTFVRKRGERDHVYVRHDDGSTTDWAFPSYGDGLPHDLCHLVVEDELGLEDGFWGLVDRHVEVGLVDNQATLMRGGRPLGGQPGVDLSGLMQAEAAVAALGQAFVEVDGTAGALPDAATPQAVAAIRRRLGDLADRWRALDDRSSIVLTFPTSTLVSGRRARAGPVERR